MPFVLAPLPLDVAVHRLHLCTGHRWRVNSFLSLAFTRNVRLLARAPVGVATVLGQIDDAEGELRPGAPLADPGFAALLPVHLDQLLRQGHTVTEYPEDFDASEYVTRWLVQPLQVSRADVLVPHQAMKATLEVWKAAKRGELVAHEMPDRMWHAVTRRLTQSQLESIARQPELRLVTTLAQWRHSMTLPEPSLPPERAFSGQLRAFDQIRPRALWLMDFFYQTRHAWYVQRRNKIRKSSLIRRVAGQLEKDGTRGPQGDRLSETAVTKLVLEWAMSPLPIQAAGQVSDRNLADLLIS